jgi:hypothetical protein
VACEKADGVREEMARSTKLVERWKNANTGDGDVFAEAVNARDGVTLGGVLIHTGKSSFTPESAAAAGDSLVITDNRNRVLVYSVETGERRARFFGSHPKLSRHGDRMCLGNGRGQLAIYDLQSMKQTSEFSFAAPVLAHEFSADGKQLLVLTNDQTAFVLDASTGNVN